MQKYLVTGASGFIGSTLVKRLGTNATSVVRKPTNLDLHETTVIGDINKDTDWTHCLENIDVVVHLAGIAHKSNISCEEYNEVNHLGTIKLAQDAINAGVKRFVFISTIGVLGLSGTFDDNSIPEPHNDYARSKLDAENGLLKLAQQTGLEVVIIRPTLVYGPKAPGNFGLLCKLINKTPFLPFGLSSNKRSFISVENLVDLIVTCSNHSNAAGNIFLGSESTAISTKDFTNQIALGLRKKIIQLPIPPSLAKLAFALIRKPGLYTQLFKDLSINSDKSQQILDWVPPHTMAQTMTQLHESNND
ncbi:NAD-dependent epimerase/dehydratase family protein [Vibrio rarus]|uniref:NAD-dependent epimerase/dehydratase family protein n=1 Tax=Vibrio rarus TaxID=413403 RepID=UPI0021C3D302|nr:NAD-dependent epimerase/dehydratase family protein [Vibrio rarus]